MSDQTPLVCMEQVSVWHQGKSVLHEVSLAVQPHDFITIIGPNGAGKTLLLSCLMGLRSPDSGRITRRERLRLGYMPQRLIPEPTLPMPVRRFLSLRLNASTALMDEVIAQTGIEALLSRQMHALSGGELQRVLLARALLHQPELLVLDEPAQNLDISGQLAFYRLLERVYARMQVSIVMVSHDLHMVMASTQQVICLFHHICCEGRPEEVQRHPEFINLFGDDMARMMRVYQHSHEHSHACE